MRVGVEESSPVKRLAVSNEKQQTSPLWESSRSEGFTNESRRQKGKGQRESAPKRYTDLCRCRRRALQKARG